MTMIFKLSSQSTELSQVLFTTVRTMVRNSTEATTTKRITVIERLNTIFERIKMYLCLQPIWYAPWTTSALQRLFAHYQCVFVFFCLLLLLTVRFALLFSFVTSFSFLLKLYKHNYIIKTYMVFSFSSYFFVDMCSVTVVLSRSIIVKRDEPTSCRFARMETLRIFSIKTNNEIAFTYEFDSNEVVDGFNRNVTFLTCLSLLNT